jgi:hypothetical protein
MPNHFSTIGFAVDSGDDVETLLQQVAPLAHRIPAKGRTYLRWAGHCGEELWIQLDRAGQVLGANPHFSGKSMVRVDLRGAVRRQGDSALDGAFRGAAEEDAPNSYPLVFDSPDAALHSDLKFPAVVEVQIAAFAHEISFYESPDAYLESQGARTPKFSSQCFIPSGLFSPDGTKTEPPNASAFFTGHVIEAGVRENGLTRRPFYWAFVETACGRYDVVIDRDLLPQVPAAGGVLSGSFWLTGRITSSPKPDRSWLRKVFRGRGV